MKPFISSVAVAVSVLALVSTAEAQEVCMAADEMKAALIDWYGEYPVEAAADDTTEVWASAETGTWTIFRTFSDGQACVVSQGDNWTTAPRDNEILAQILD